jgi:hypothetical protein
VLGLVSLSRSSRACCLGAGGAVVLFHPGRATLHRFVVRVSHCVLYY